MKALLVFLCSILLTGCTAGSSQNVNQDAISFLNGINSYYAVLKLDIKDTGETRSYRYKQWVQLPDRYRMEVLEPDALKGKVTASDGKTTRVYHPEFKNVVELEYPEVYQDVPLFLGDFMSRYWNSEEGIAEIVQIQGKDYVAFTCPAAGVQNRYHKEKLLLDMKQKKPISLTVYDQSGAEITSVSFEEFRVLPELDPKLFLLSDKK